MWCWISQDTCNLILQMNRRNRDQLQAWTSPKLNKRRCLKVRSRASILMQWFPGLLKLITLTSFPIMKRASHLLKAKETKVVIKYLFTKNLKIIMTSWVHNIQVPHPTHSLNKFIRISRTYQNRSIWDKLIKPVRINLWYSINNLMYQNLNMRPSS